MQYYIITYGCQMNKSDSERIAGFLEKYGYKEAPKIDWTDLIVVNMCSVRQSAVDRVFGLAAKLKKLKSKNLNLKTILTGCILKKDWLKLAQYFDYTLKIKDLAVWPISPPAQCLEVSPPNIVSKYAHFPVAYVPISTGCNNFCTYCVVPYTRGPEVWRPAGEIIDEVRKLVKNGFREIWLLGQNVNSYKSKIQISNVKPNPKSKFQKIDFPKLLEMVNNIPGNFKIYFTSPHPKNFSAQLIDVIAKGKKIAKEIHLPIQSGNDEILKKMNRNYSVREYKNLVKKIRQKIPGVSFSTDVIVGFPGETKKQFENTVKVLKEIGFRQAYVAAYSPRPGTAAAKMEDGVPSFEKKQRKRIILEMFK